MGPQTPAAPKQVVLSQRFAAWGAAEPPRHSRAAPAHSAAQRAFVTEHARAQAGVTGLSVPLWTPGDWWPLEFPLDQPDAARAFATGAFRHGGWRMLEDFVTDLDSAYSAVSTNLRAVVPRADRMRAGASQLRQAIGLLRPRVAESLAVIEQLAVEELRRRLASATTSALSQAKSLLVMPHPGGKPLGPSSLLVARCLEPEWLRRAPPALTSGNAEGKAFREQLRALQPTAERMLRWDHTKDVQEALRAMETLLRKARYVSPSARALLMGGEDAQRILEAARDAGTLAGDLERLLTSHKAVLDEWRAAQSTFGAARRAAADRYPVLHRFGFADIVTSTTEDDAALGWRVSGILARVYDGAVDVRARYVDGVPGKRAKLNRPAAKLAKALKGKSPPSDPVRFVMAAAEESVWAHDGLIQATLDIAARGGSALGPFSLLEAFHSSVAVQALAEAAQQRREGVLKGVAGGLGLGAALALMHAVAPPVALIVDAGFAAYDLTTASADLGKRTAESRCTFDETLALGPEPSLAWFLVTQAFNVLTVG